MMDDNGVNLLVIDGDLVNLRTEQLSVPRLRFAVLGDKGQELYVWTAQADRSALKPGETLNFRRRLAAPPSDGATSPCVSSRRLISPLASDDRKAGAVAMALADNQVVRVLFSEEQIARRTREIAEAVKAKAPQNLLVVPS